MKSQRRVSGVGFVFSLVVLAGSVQANPVGETVVGGAARFDRSPGRLTISQGSDRLIVNWRSFSIGAGETTRFVQPSATSVALNRVMSGDPSRIFGNLEANGRVFLINPNGVLVGKGATVNTRGFVASTLDVSDASFLSQAKLTLSGDSTAAVVNEGAIEAIGGDVFLIGRTVENSGSIRAANGTVGLAAGNEVVIVPTGRERVSVIAGNADGAPAGTGVKNSGTIEAVSAELKAAGGNIYALAINNGGTVRATGVRREGGRVFLTSDGGNIENSGTLSAQKANGSGGTVFVAGGHNGETPATVINSGTIVARGDAEGTRGGQVRLTGDHVGLFGTGLIDVSGHSGGGVALVGGDYQGGNSRIQNAQRTFIGSDAVIRADALENGNGGRVIVWANEFTRFHGNISARGGASSGNGGFVEVSGKVDLLYRGLANLLAPNGRIGTLLLDPKNIIVANDPPPPIPGADVTSGSVADVTTGAAFANNAVVNADQNFGIRVTDLQNALAAADVVLNANNNITFSDPVTSASGNDLELHAGNSIFINANLTLAGSFSATFNDIGAAATAANRDPGAATFTMAVGTTIVAPGGITIDAGNLLVDSSGPRTLAENSGTITLGGLSTASVAPPETSGDIEITGDSDVNIGGSLVTGAATKLDDGGDDTGESGHIAITSGGIVTISGTASLTTGNASLTGNHQGNDVDQAISGNISITATVGGVIINGNLTTGNADVETDVGGNNANDEKATSGNITVSAGTSVSGAGQLVTGNASLGGVAEDGNDDITTGNISVTAGAGGASGGISLSATDALKTGNALRLNAAGDNILNADTRTSGDIILSSRDEINNNSLGNPLSVRIGGTPRPRDPLAPPPPLFDPANPIPPDTAQRGSVRITTTAGGDVFLTSSSTLRVGTVNMGAGDLTLIADEIDFTGADGALPFTVDDSVQGSGTLRIRAVTTDHSIVLGNASDSDADYAPMETLDLTDNDLDALKAGFAGITIGDAATGGTVTIAGTALFENDVTLAGSSIAVNAALAASGKAVTLTAQTGGITDGNTGIDVTAASLTVAAETGINLDTDISTLTSATTTAGNIDIDNSLPAVTATGLAVDVVSAPGSVTLKTKGAITDGNVGAVNVTAASLTVAAETGINLDTDISTLTSATIDSGTINIDNSQAVTATGLAVDVIDAGTGIVILNTVGAITDGNANGTVNVTGSSLSATAAGGIDLDTDIDTLTLADAVTGTIDINNTGALTVTDAQTDSGLIRLEATGDLVATLVRAGLGAAETGAGDVELTTTGVGSDVAVGEVRAVNNQVTIDSSAAITDGDGTVDVTANSLSAEAAGGINLDTAIATLTLADAVTGTIDINNTGALTVTDAQTDSGLIRLEASGDLVATLVRAGLGAAETGAGNVELTTTGVGSDVAVGEVRAVGNLVSIDSSAAITDADGTVDVTAASLSAEAVGGIDLDTALSTLVLADAGTGTIDINNTGALTVTDAQTDIGSITIEASGILTATLVQAGRGPINDDTGAGDVQLTTTGGGNNVAVGVVRAVGDQVSIDSSAAITDADGTVDVTALSLSAEAVGGIDLDTAISTLVLADAGTGAIDINNTGALTVTDAQTDSGSITLEASGILTATLVQAGRGLINDDTGAGDVQLTTTGGGNNVAVGEVRAVGNLVSIDSAAAITDADPGVDVTAASLSAEAVGGIDLDTAISTLVLADVGTGTIDIGNDGALIVGDAQTDNGTISLTANGNLVATLVRAGLGAVSGNGSVNLTGTSVGLGNVTADSDSVSVTASGNITESGTDVGADVTGSTINLTTSGGSIGTSLNPLGIGGAGGTVTLSGQNGNVHVADRSSGNGNVAITESQTSGGSIKTEFSQAGGGHSYDVFYDIDDGDFTLDVAGNLTTADNKTLRVDGTLTLNAGGAIGTSVTSPLSTRAAILSGSSGTGFSIKNSGELGLGTIALAAGNLLIRSSQGFVLDDDTVLTAGANVILVAEGGSGITVPKGEEPTINSRFLIYGQSGEITSPPVFKTDDGRFSIGSLIADRLDSPRFFDEGDLDPFNPPPPGPIDTLSHFIFEIKTEPFDDPSQFIDIPMELYRPLSINFGEYDPTKFGEVGDLWMSSSELYEMERRAGKGTNAIPSKVDKSKYITNDR